MPPSPMSDLIPFPKRINGRTQWIGSRSDSALNHSCSLSVDHHGAALSIRSSRRRCSSAGRSAIALSFCSLTDRRGNGSPRAKTSSITSWSSVRSRRTWLTLAREQWSFRAKSARDACPPSLIASLHCKARETGFRDSPGDFLTARRKMIREASKTSRKVLPTDRFGEPDVLSTEWLTTQNHFPGILLSSQV